MVSSFKRGARLRNALTVMPVLVSVGIVGLSAAALAVALRPSSGDSFETSLELHRVRLGDFEITTPCSGELTALNQVEIRNQLESRAVITEIKDEGKSVADGDVLVRFNDEDIVNNIKDAEDSVSTTDNDFIAAEASLEIKEKERESELDKAQLEVELADLALKAWQEGESVQTIAELDLDLNTAQKEFDRLLDLYERSLMLFDDKFISANELKVDEIAKIRAEAALARAINKQKVYLKYVFHQEKKQKESDLDQATAERDRVEQKFEAEVRQSRSQVASKKHRVNSAKERLEKLQRQLESCIVTAPSSGLVVYASSLESSRWGGSDDPPQVGTEVQRNRLVMVLPDTSEMVAEVKVNEALSGLIQPGQRARVISDAVPDKSFDGEVLSVGVMAVSGGWVDRNRRDYTVRIKLDTPANHELKPAMRCKAEIFVDRLVNVMHVPSQAVFWARGRSFVYAPRDGGYAQAEVAVGRSSELYTEIIDGLREGDTVLLREPEPERIVSRLELDDETPTAPDAAPKATAPPKGRRGRRG